MGKEIYNIINDMAEVLNVSQMQKLQEVLINRLSENNTVDYLQTGDKDNYQNVTKKSCRVSSNK